MGELRRREGEGDVLVLDHGLAHAPQAVSVIVTEVEALEVSVLRPRADVSAPSLFPPGVEARRGGHGVLNVDGAWPDGIAQLGSDHDVVTQ